LTAALTLIAGIMPAVVLAYPVFTSYVIIVIMSLGLKTDTNTFKASLNGRHTTKRIYTIRILTNTADTTGTIT